MTCEAKIRLQGQCFMKVKFPIYETANYVWFLDFFHSLLFSKMILFLQFLPIIQPH
jgi:hypothetical protein